MTDGRHNCAFVRGESWRPPERVGAEIHRVKMRGKACVCGRFEPSVRRPLPTRRQRSGVETTPAATTLLKLSSDESLAARELLQLLVQDGRRERRWESIARRLVSRGFTLPQLEHIVDVLCGAGIVRVGETNTGGIHADWHISQILIEPAALIGVCEITGVVPEHLRRELLLAAIEPALRVRLPGGRYQAVACRVQQLLQEHVDALQAGAASALVGLSGDVIATPSRWPFFESILRAVAGLAEHLAEGTPTTAESFSARVYGTSKDFTSPRRDALVRLVGVELADLGVVERDTEVLVFGPIQCCVDSYVDSYVADGRATGSWLGLPGSALHCGTLHFETNRMAVVENLTPFEALARSCAREGTWPFFGLFGGGYISSTGTALIGMAIEKGVRNVAVWADMDADGILLAQDVVDLVSSSGALATVIAMDHGTFCAASRSYAIEPSRLRLLAEHLPRLTQPLADLASEVLSSGRGVEQEIVLQEGLAGVTSWALPTADAPVSYGQ